MANMTINVLGFGELYRLTLNAMAAFMSQGQSTQEGFFALLRITGLFGIIMASIGYIKQRDPMIYAKWVLAYILVLEAAVIPKTTVDIYDVSAQKVHVVANVPVLFATTASIITNLGFGLAQWYDKLFSAPEDLTYSRTGVLFGSKVIQAARDFRIINPELKAEMSDYLRNCVVGDIRLTHRYAMKELSESTHIWDLISKSASPIRMTKVNGRAVTCKEAAAPSKGVGQDSHSLKAKLDLELKNAYTVFGMNLFGKPKNTTEEKILETHLDSIFNYYQLLTDESVNIMQQSIMINAIGDGIKDYQAFTDSTAGIINNQVTKSEVQHRWSWQIAGEKSAWFLPILHALLTMMLFGLFPIVVVMTTLPNGVAIFRGYVQFFLSLQFWPVLFAILNAAMTVYAKNKSAEFGGITLVNIDKLDELHGDISGVAGYLMLMVPFIAKGLVSNLSDAFNNLATSMTGHLQGSAMAVANEAASASFSLGQTSFYNTSANNFSANKHDSNWSHMHGMHTEQMATGVTKTTTPSGETVFDVSAGMTRGGVGINKNDGLTSSINEAAEESRQASTNAHQNFQTSVSNFAHKALQLSEVAGHDMRLGDGVSKSETGQYQKALSNMHHIASDVAKRTGVSTDKAFASLSSLSMNGQMNAPLTGALRIASRGMLDISGNIAGHSGDSSNSSDRAHDSVDAGISAKEAKDFSQSFSQVQHFVKNHHFDDTHSNAAHLSSQMGADLRDAQVAGEQYDASIGRTSRIQHAQNYAKAHGDQINQNLEQAFTDFVGKEVGSGLRDRLFSHPEDKSSIEALKGLGERFLSSEREALINRFDKGVEKADIDGLYRRGTEEIEKRSMRLDSAYETQSDRLYDKGGELGLGIDKNSKDRLFADVNEGMVHAKESIDAGGEEVRGKEEALQAKASMRLRVGRENAKRGVAFNYARNNEDKEKDS